MPAPCRSSRDTGRRKLFAGDRRRRQGFPEVINFSTLGSQITDPADCYDNGGTFCPTFNPRNMPHRVSRSPARTASSFIPSARKPRAGSSYTTTGTSGNFDGTANITIGLAGGVERSWRRHIGRRRPGERDNHRTGRRQHRSGFAGRIDRLSRPRSRRAITPTPTLWRKTPLRVSLVFRLRKLLDGGSGLALAEVEVITGAVHVSASDRRRAGNARLYQAAKESLTGISTIRRRKYAFIAFQWPHSVTLSLGLVMNPFIAGAQSLSTKPASPRRLRRRSST